MTESPITSGGGPGPRSFSGETRQRHEQTSPSATGAVPPATRTSRRSRRQLMRRGVAQPATLLALTALAPGSPATGAGKPPPLLKPDVSAPGRYLENRSGTVGSAEDKFELQT